VGRVECVGIEVSQPILADPFKISVGGYGNACALDKTGLVCWSYSPDFLSSMPTLSENVTDVALGASHSCVIDSSEVFCWGSNSHSQLDIPSLENPRSIAVGRYESCVLDGDIVKCWRDNQRDLTKGINVQQVTAGQVAVCGFGDNGVTCSGGGLNQGTTNYIEGMNASLMFDPDGDGYNNQRGIDAFPLDSSEWLDTDLDGIGNNTDSDDDGDLVPDSSDVFPLDASESADTDSDGVGDNADAFPNNANETLDTDLDTVGDNADNCVSVANPDQLNSDTDLLGNLCDDDDDNDGLSDASDALPLDPTEQLDTDSDGIGNNADSDDDNDGVDDINDLYSLNVLYSADTDNDGMPDAWETRYGLDPNDSSDATSDQDQDGVPALTEFYVGTIPSGSLDIDGNGDYDALTDGLLLLRGMFGLTEDALISGAVASDAIYASSSEIATRIDMLGDLVDIDGNGQADALTDGLVILRYLFGVRDDVLVDGVVALNATVSSAADIGGKIDTLMPSLQP
jgi:hypothetical protein